MAETFDRISDGSLDVGGSSDGGYSKLPKAGQIDGIPAIDDNDFLNKLEKKYNKYQDGGSDDFDDDDSAGSTKEPKGKKSKAKNERDNARAWKLLGGGKMAPRF